jgi:DNA mismatch endonuclease (patch repair protein)
MSKIRSKNTGPEKGLRKLLKRSRIRFTTYKKLPGTPDLVLKGHKIAIFVDGEFWHGYNWERKGIIPRKGFWKKKILRNIARDKRVNLELRQIGWKVVRIWESEIDKKPAKVISRLRRLLAFA